MVTITAILLGEEQNLDMVSTCGITNHSKKSITGNKMEVSWIFEGKNQGKSLGKAIENIDLNEVNKWDCTLISIG